MSRGEGREGWELVCGFSNTNVTGSLDHDSWGELWGLKVWIVGFRKKRKKRKKKRQDKTRKENNPDSFIKRNHAVKK